MTDTYTVKMPDGYVMKGVPIGTSKSDIMAKYQQQRQSEITSQSSNSTIVDNSTMPLSQQGQGQTSFINQDDQRYVGSAKPETSFWDGVLDKTVDTSANLARIMGSNLSAPGMRRGKHIEGYSSKPTPSINSIVEQKNNYLQQQALKGQVPSGLGKFTGEVVGSLPALLAAGTNPYLAGGASAMAISDADNPLDLATDTGLGAIFGKIGDNVVGNLGKFVAPKLNRGAQALKDMGVNSTIGQMMSGKIKTFEDQLMSIPWVRGAIVDRREEAMSQWTREVYNDVLKPLNIQLPDGMELDDTAYKWVSKQISNSYDDLLPNVKFQADEEFSNGLTQVLKMSLDADGTGPAMKKLQGVITNEILPRFNAITGQMTGTGWKELDGLLAADVRQYLGKDAKMEKYALGLEELRRLLRGTMERSNVGTNVGKQIKATNQAFARKIPVRNAVGSSNFFGEFTPQQLVSGSKVGLSRNAKANARSNAQNLGYTGKQLMSSTPNSGTAERLLMSGLLLGGGGATGAAASNDENGGNPWLTGGLGTLGALAVPRAAYSKVGQNAMRGLFGRGTQSPFLQAMRQKLQGAKTPAAILSGRQSPDTLDQLGL